MTDVDYIQQVGRGKQVGEKRIRLPLHFRLLYATKRGKQFRRTSLMFVEKKRYYSTHFLLVKYVDKHQ